MSTSEISDGLERLISNTTEYDVIIFFWDKRLHCYRLQLLKMHISTATERLLLEAGSHWSVSKGVEEDKNGHGPNELLFFVGSAYYCTRTYSINLNHSRRNPIKLQRKLTHGKI